MRATVSLGLSDGEEINAPAETQARGSEVGRKTSSGGWEGLRGGRRERPEK